MAFASLAEVRDQTTFSEVSALSDAKLQKYIDLANAYLRRHTGIDYRDATDPDILTDLERVTVLLVEYIWLQDQPEIKESNYTGVQTERIGTYSYNIGGKNGDSTGNRELDDLLLHLSPKQMGINFFSISGPSRTRGNHYNPHAYVTDVEEE